MRDLTKLTARQLLAISAPELLFSKSLDEAKREYRALARQWHPDCNRTAESEEIFAHISALYRLALKKIGHGDWYEPAEKIEQETPGQKNFRRTNGKITTIRYMTARPFELGSMYIGTNSVAFDIDDVFQDLFRDGCRQMRALKFNDGELTLELCNWLPQIVDSFKTPASNVVVLRKTPDQLLLADVLEFHKGRLPEIEHVGWILNCLYNLACYLELIGIAHNAVSPQTVFISPLRHAVMLLGGWWYATAFETRMIAVPERSLRFIPPDIIDSKRADTRSNLELIKSVGRELLGDALGVHLQLDEDLPQNMVNWLMLPSSGSAIEDYNSWKHYVLEDAFGSPKFVAMNLDSTQLYKEN
jgi:hypothetical protein